MSRTRVTGTVLGLLIALSLLHADACRGGASPDWVQSYHFPHGSVGPLAMRDGYAYVLNGWTRGDGILVFDVRDPASPRFVDGMCGRGYLVDYAFEDGIMYASARFSLMVVDISNPAECRLVRNLMLGFPQMEVERLALAGDRLLVGGRGSGLRVYDVSEADSPVLTSYLPEYGYVQQLDAAGDLVLIKPRTGKASLARFDKDVLSICTELDGKGAYRFVDSALYESRGSDTFVYDVSDPANPTVVTNVARIDPVGMMAPGRLLARAPEKALAVVDVTRPLAPVVLRRISLPEDIDILRIAVEGDVCAVLDRSRVSLRVLDIAGQEAVERGELAILRNEGDAEIGEKYAYLGFTEASRTTVLTVDLAKPGFMDFSARVDQVPMSKENAFKTHDVVRAVGLKLLGKYLLTGDGLVSVADPPAPKVVRDMTRPAASIVVKDGLAYLAQSDRLTVLDVSALPEMPVRAVYEPEGDDNHIVDVAVAGKLVYLVNNSQGEPRVESVSIDLSGEARRIGSCRIHGAITCALSGNLLYVPAARWGGADSLMILDVSDPAAPMIVKRLDGVVGNGCRRMRVRGDRLFFTDNLLGIKVADISDPLNPVVVQSFLGPTDVGNTFNDFNIIGDRLYGLRHSQLDVWDLGSE